MGKSGMDRSNTRAGSQFWMFHGREPALEKPGEALEGLQRVRDAKYPGRNGWHLSIYEKPAAAHPDVSRETITT